MDIPKFNTASISGKKVLVAPLDWGLGHVTRCIPIVRALLQRGNTVIIAATGSRKALLALELPEVSIIGIPDYEIRLGKAGIRQIPELLRQLPKLISVIKRENSWLAGICLKEKIDLVISDNRYGLYHPDVHCIFITHQLFIRSGLGEWIDRRLMKLHFRLIGRFSECWIPDNANPELALAGRLSHPPLQPVFPVTYIGLLSRFAGNRHGTAERSSAALPLEADRLLILLSGPEPHRTTAETIIMRQLNLYQGPVTFVRGLPGEHGETGTDPVSGAEPGDGNNERKIVAHLDTKALELALMQAGRIICRSGYSSLMDLMALGRTATLVATPGQAEQEYLANHMKEKGWMELCPQSELSLTALTGGHSGSNSGNTNRRVPAFFFFDGELPALTLRPT